MSAIHFEAKILSVESLAIIHLPKEASSKLPSRGMAYVAGTINSAAFQAPLEPDGKGSHWFAVSKQMMESANAKVGETVKLEIEPIKEWPEPEVPEDLEKALKASPKEYALWKDVTPMARWDWIRWVSSTKNPETRKKRIAVEIDKLKKGMRRPCCFNRSMCCNPDVSKNGVLSSL